MQDKSIQECMFGANLVILAEVCDELSFGKIKFTDGRTDASNANIPSSWKAKGKNSAKIKWYREMCGK